ncbi:MAG: hypothetical protein OEY18_14830, partial [Candidatus Aminicenantes bacterium]|nr:hypothetical protein [Candidatus Aminicenantes bacterium]
MRIRVAIFFISVGILLSFSQWSDIQWVQTSGPKGDVIHALAVSGNNLFASMGHREADKYGGLFLSKDNGESWTAVNSGLPKKIDVYCLVVSGTYL